MSAWRELRKRLEEAKRAYDAERDPPADPVYIVCVCGRLWPVDHPAGPAAYLNHPCREMARFN